MTEETEVKKAFGRKTEMRPAMRADDSRARAAARTAEIRGHRGGNDLDEMDRFHIDSRDVPDGWSYEWKRKTLLGKEDPAYQVELARGGWEPVPADRHPETMPTGKYATIERDGMILMERPKELTDEARQVELRRARNQVRAKEQQLSNAPDGTMTRDHAKVRPNISKGYEPMPVPKDN
jgi:hypothetical protein